MNAVALKSFGFGDQLVRVVDRDDAGVWFVGNDVCAALEIKNARDGIGRLEDDERDCVGIADAMGRDRQTTIISESGVYALIFTSRKAVAVKFRKWVTGEVLPSIRKTGRYEQPTNDDEGNGGPLGEIEAPFLGTKDEREQIRVAVLMVRECKDLYGVVAGRQMWQKLGFPVPQIDLAPDQSDSSAPKEGDVVKWGSKVALTPSRRDATHKQDLYHNYVTWCGNAGFVAMVPERFFKMMLAMFGTEEHPEMIRAIMKRPRAA